MGCCGCSLQQSAVVAAVFGLIQGITDLAIAAVLITKFTPENFYTTFRISSSGYTWTVDNLLGYEKYKALSEAHIAFTVIWLVSSILLVVGIVKENAFLHKQWTLVTSAIILAGVIMFIICCTQLKYNTYDIGENTYLILLMAVLMRWGILGLIADICLAIYVYQRANQMLMGPQQPPHMLIISGQPGTVFQSGQPVGVVMQPGQPVGVMMQPGQPVGMIMQPGQSSGMMMSPNAYGQQSYYPPQNTEVPPQYEKQPPAGHLEYK